MKFSEMTITRTKQLDLAGAGVLLLFLLIGKLPFEKSGWLRVVVLAAALLVAVAVLAETFLPREKSDERAVKNEHRADSIIVNVVFVLGGIALACTLFTEAFSIAFYDLTIGFVLLWLGRSALFLALERFGA